MPAFFGMQAFFMLSDRCALTLEDKSAVGAGLPRPYPSAISFL